LQVRYFDMSKPVTASPACEYTSSTAPFGKCPGRLDGRERRRNAEVAVEEPLALAERDRIQVEVQAVDEARRDERSREIAAAHDVDVLEAVLEGPHLLDVG